MKGDGIAGDHSESANYAVGFRHPPLHTRFKPGVSGNPPTAPILQASCRSQ